MYHVIIVDSVRVYSDIIIIRYVHLWFCFVWFLHTQYEDEYKLT